jgi:hypothetical protein
LSPVSTVAFAWIWAHDAVKDLKTAISVKIPFQFAEILTEAGWQYRVDIDGSLPYGIESLSRIEQYGGPPRKLVLNIINTAGKTRVRSSDVWFVPFGGFILLCLEPGRRLLLYPLLILPPRFIPSVYYVWLVLAIALPLFCFGFVFLFRKRQ